MARTPLRNLRLDNDTWERWRKIAADREQPVTGLIIEAVESLIAREGRPGPPPRNGRVHVPPRVERAVACEHFVPAGTFCKRGCDG